ncbi:DNA-binding IclR family transcriptional regulator [Kineococcus xinjiangensis]|uniref:DNA-binding IclR family transcriptional regulator n=1 Tax=Kineococcus xinjiangensis TaxID=512762 RepID=A0A2S6IEH4_9ACTN|nr:IclR family transcriptional regulator [Kineococcus xinjiangensis]PPK92609.1 DNA-binding IclR family transcriptional regulator [Kineococcus xinjiangensis]
MPGQVPAARAALAVLRLLSQHGGPVTAASLARDLGLPRSSTYHLLAAMVEEGFVVHLPEERRYALGVAAFEVGSAFSYREPLARLGRPLLDRLVDRTGESAHLAVLHGRDTYYVVEERARRRPSLVTDVGVRLPAHLTASGRAMLAAMPAAQVRALFPDRGAFTTRHGTGPASPAELRAVLARARRTGWAEEDGDVTPGLSSVASAVLDPNGHPVASIAVTFTTPGPGSEPGARAAHLAAETRRAAAELSRRLGGRPR